jgi:hypothetical protein
VETVRLKTLYVLVFIELSTRRVHLSGVSAQPDLAWVTQQARNLALDGRLEDARFLIRDETPSTQVHSMRSSVPRV